VAEIVAQYPVSMRSRWLGSNSGALTACARRIRLAEALAVVSLLCLVVQVLIPTVFLETAALVLLAGAILAGWSAVLAWRLPVLPSRIIAFLGVVWVAGLVTSILLVLWADSGSTAVGLRVAAFLLAAALSLCVGALFFRALFRKRTTPWIVRALSLLSPVAVLILIVVQLID